MSEVNEVPTYKAPEGVNGPTLGRDLPDGCERLLLRYRPDQTRDNDWSGGVVDAAWHGDLYWWRPVPLKVGDRVHLTGTVTEVRAAGGWHKVTFDGDYPPDRTIAFPTAALTRVVGS